MAPKTHLHPNPGADRITRYTRSGATSNTGIRDILLQKYIRHGKLPSRRSPIIPSLNVVLVHRFDIVPSSVLFPCDQAGHYIAVLITTDCPCPDIICACVAGARCAARCAQAWYMAGECRNRGTVRRCIVGLRTLFPSPSILLPWENVHACKILKASRLDNVPQRYPHMTAGGLKAIAPVPTATEFLDIILSKTQRKTPTVSFARQCSTVCLTGRGDQCTGHPQKLQDQPDTQFLHAQSEIHARFV